jgi:hypothetical protein
MPRARIGQGDAPNFIAHFRTIDFIRRMLLCRTFSAARRLPNLTWLKQEMAAIVRLVDSVKVRE